MEGAHASQGGVQNSRAMYYMLRKSISGALENLVFGLLDNLPRHEDGPLLFKRLTTYTSMAMLNLAIVSLNQINALDPFKFDYNVPKVNMQLGPYRTQEDPTYFNGISEH